MDGWVDIRDFGGLGGIKIKGGGRLGALVFSLFWCLGVGCFCLLYFEMLPTDCGHGSAPDSSGREGLIYIYTGCCQLVKHLYILERI